MNNRKKSKKEAEQTRKLFIGFLRACRAELIRTLPTLLQVSSSILNDFKVRFDFPLILVVSNL